MFGNTISLTVAGSPVVFTLRNDDGYSGEYLYRGTGEEMVLKIRHSTSKKAAVGEIDRHNVEITHTVFATPTTFEVVDKAYVVIEQRKDSPSIDLILALSAWLSASSGSNSTRVLNWES